MPLKFHLRVDSLLNLSPYRAALDFIKHVHLATYKVMQLPEVRGS